MGATRDQGERAGFPALSFPKTRLQRRKSHAKIKTDAIEIESAANGAAMGLKIRRLKSGFAYYAEYKFGRHCIYEKIGATSAREAKRIYSARLKELRASLPKDKDIRSLTQNEARGRRITAALSAMLRKLIDKRVISEAEALELLPEFSSISPPEPVAAGAGEFVQNDHR